MGVRRFDGHSPPQRATAIAAIADGKVGTVVGVGTVGTFLTIAPTLVFPWLAAGAIRLSKKTRLPVG